MAGKMRQEEKIRKPGKTETAVSAGGIVLRKQKGRLEVLLCGRAQPPLWALPKGGPNSGEGLEETALREVTEETGVEVALRDKVGAIRYWFTSSGEGVRYHKTVHFFLMLPIGGSPERHDKEFDYVRWFSLEEALQAMTYGNEADLVRRAAEMVSSKED